MDFGKKLRSILEFEGLQQKEFAEMINVHPSTLSGYINDGKQPDFELVVKIADTLKVSTDYLLDHNDNPQGPPLSAGELSMLTKLRRLPEDKRAIIVSLVEMLSDK